VTVFILAVSRKNQVVTPLEGVEKITLDDARGKIYHMHLIFCLRLRALCKRGVSAVAVMVFRITGTLNKDDPMEKEQERQFHFGASV